MLRVMYSVRINATSGPVRDPVAWRAIWSGSCHEHINVLGIFIRHIIHLSVILVDLIWLTLNGAFTYPQTHTRPHISSKFIREYSKWATLCICALSCGDLVNVIFFWSKIISIEWCTIWQYTLYVMGAFVNQRAGLFVAILIIDVFCINVVNYFWIYKVFHSLAKTDIPVWLFYALVTC